MTYDPVYAKRWRLDQARGIPRLVDPGPMNEHVAMLYARGWSYRAIAGAAGVAVQSVNRYRMKGNVNRDIAARILAVDPNTIPSKPSKQTTQVFVPRTGVTRRIEALLFMGWTLDYLHENYGLARCILYQVGRWCQRDVYERAVKAYDELAWTLGPSERTRNRARKRGYLGPMHWEHIDIDEEPDVEPEHVPRAKQGIDDAAVMRYLEGDRSVRLTRAEKAEAVRRWDATGQSRNELERRTGLNVQRFGLLNDDEEGECA